MAFSFADRIFLIDQSKQRYFDADREVFGDAATLVATVAGAHASAWWNSFACGAVSPCSELVERTVFVDAPDLPQDSELERTLLGWCLLKPEIVPIVEQELSPLDLLDAINQAVFASILTAHAEGVSPLSLIREHADEPAIGGMTLGRYFAYLASFPRLPLNAEENARALAIQVRRCTEVETSGNADRTVTSEEEREPTPEEKPIPYKFLFGPMRWSQQFDAGEKYDWLIKGIAPLGENMLIAGPSRSGKTFETMDMAMHVARGKDFAGRRTKQMGVVYCFYEAKRGARKRMNAYQIFHKLPLEGIPFVALTRAPNLYASTENAEHLATEINELTKEWSVPVGVIVVDTHNAATRGSSEIRSDDIAKILDNYGKVADMTGAALWIVGHTNDEGRHRGNQQIFNTIETAIHIERIEDKGTGERKDLDGHIIRRATVIKQREEVDKISWEFVLPRIVIGLDEDGDEITSCVSMEPARSAADTVREQPSKKRAPVAAGSFHLNAGEVLFMRALLNALSKSGIPPPPQLELPGSIGRVVRWHDFSIEFRALEPNDEQNTDVGKERYRNKMKARVRRARTSLQNYKVIGVDNVSSGEGEGFHVLWPTGRPVDGPGFVFPTPAPVRGPDPVAIDQSTGRPMTSIDGGDEPF